MPNFLGAIGMGGVARAASAMTGGAKTSPMGSTLGALGAMTKNPASPMVPGSKASDVFSKTGQTQPTPTGTPASGMGNTLGGIVQRMGGTATPAVAPGPAGGAWFGNIGQAISAAPAFAGQPTEIGGWFNKAAAWGGGDYGYQGAGAWGGPAEQQWQGGGPAEQWQGSGYEAPEPGDAGFFQQQVGQMGGGNYEAPEPGDPGWGEALEGDDVEEMRRREEQAYQEQQAQQQPYEQSYDQQFEAPEEDYGGWGGYTFGGMGRGRRYY